MKEIKYRLVKGIFYLLSLLPLCVLYAVSDLFYFLTFHVIRYRRRIVEKNLLNSFPEKTESERLRIEKEFYVFFCDYMIETIKLLSFSPNDMMRHMEMIGVDQMEESLTRHDFCFVYLGHFCNWEWISSLPLWCKQGTHCAQIYHPLRSDTFDSLFLHMRSRFGGENVRKKETLRRIMALRNEGKKSIVGFISDQTPRWVSIHEWVTFLNQDTPVFIGTERIGKKVNASIFFADIERIKRGYYRCTFRPMTEEIQTYPDYKLTELYMQELEEMIRRSPAYWLWSHNRWKRQRSDSAT